MIQQVEQLLGILNKVNFQDDRKKHQLQIVLKELTNDYLPMHLRKYAPRRLCLYLVLVRAVM